MLHRWLVMLPVLFLLSVNASASEEIPVGYKLYLGAGLTGGTVGSIVDLPPYIAFRFGIAFLPYSKTEEQTYNGTVLSTSFRMQLTTIPVAMEFYLQPWMRLAVGTHINFSSIEINLKPTEDRLYGDIVISAEEQGELKTLVSFWRVSPHISAIIAPVQLGSRIQPVLELGVMYQGGPKVSRRGTGMLEPSADNPEDFEEALGTHTYLSLFPMVGIHVEFSLPPIQEEASW